MKWVFLICCLLLCTAGAFAGGIYWERQNRPPIDDEIIFWEKIFNDNGPDDDYPMVNVGGTLTGPGLANNTYVVSCQQKEHSCDVAHADQIGPRQIGYMDPPLSYAIKKWDQDEIIASDEEASAGLCIKTTITIERKAKTLLWVEEPINQTLPMCKRTDANIRKYTIEDSPTWKKSGFGATQ